MLVRNPSMDRPPNRSPRIVYRYPDAKISYHIKLRTSRILAIAQLNIHHFHHHYQRSTRWSGMVNAPPTEALVAVQDKMLR